jgi:hypothetical protein
MAAGVTLHFLLFIKMYVRTSRYTYADTCAVLEFPYSVLRYRIVTGWVHLCGVYA